MRKLLFELAEPDAMAPRGGLRTVVRADGRAWIANATFFALSLILLGGLAHVAMRLL